MGAMRPFLPFLVAHVLLVTVHASVSLTGRINVWEFGGYGMYAAPSPSVRLESLVSHPSLDEERRFVSVQETRRGLRGGGCLFAFRESVRAAVLEDMEALGLEHLVLRFDRKTFNPERTGMTWQPMATVEGKRIEDSHALLVTTSACGRKRLDVLGMDPAWSEPVMEIPETRANCLDSAAGVQVACDDA